MKKLILSVAIALLCAVSTPNSARADAVLVQDIDTTTGWIDLVTVVDHYGGPGELHWMWRWDDPLTPANECLHFDGFSDNTPNDMMVVDVSNTINGGLPLFGDTTSGSVNIGPGYEAELIVSNLTAGGLDDPENSLVVTSMHINPAIGVFSIRGANDITSSSGGLLTNFDDVAYGAWPFKVDQFGSAMFYQPRAIWMSTAAVSTSWEVIVTGLQQAVAPPDPANPGLAANLSAVIGLRSPGGGIWVYNIDETPTSGVIDVPVDCFKKVVLADFLNGPSLTAAQGGGWDNIEMITPAPWTIDKGILVYKEEFSSALGTPMAAMTSANRLDE